MFIGPLSRDEANDVWNILLSYGAKEQDRVSFVHYFTNESEHYEFRFCGVFGGGGKIRQGYSVPYFVTMYEESSTPERERFLTAVNAELKNLAHNKYGKKGRICE